MKNGLLFSSLLFICLASFFPHFLWEVWHLRFYECVNGADYHRVTSISTVAASGDVLIALVAYIVAALSARSTDWLGSASLKPLSVYFLTGLVITVVFEYLAVEVLDLWAYNEKMPTLPPLGTGLLPVAQWVVVPAITFYAARLMYLGLLHLQAPDPGPHLDSDPGVNFLPAKARKIGNGR